MQPNTILEWIKHSGLGEFVQQTNWVFSTLESLHFIGLCFLFGSILVVDLKLMGFLPTLPYKWAFAFLPITIGSFTLMLFSGIGFFFYNPYSYYNNPAFRIKMLFVLLAGLNALAFTILEHRRVAVLGPAEQPDVLTKASAALSLTFWFIVMGLGRALPLFSSVN